MVGVSPGGRQTIFYKVATLSVHIFKGTPGPFTLFFFALSENRRTGTRCLASTGGTHGDGASSRANQASRSE